MLNNYEKYISMLDNKLNIFFKNQKPYIFCKKGCAECCKNAQYPFSEIEFLYLIKGFKELEQCNKSKIIKNIKNTIEQEKHSNNRPFTYICPFLINNQCSVYEFRGIICRTFGLLQADKSGGSDVPFCALDGLNYSNVFDIKNKKISSEMFKLLNIDVEPVAYNIRYDYLTDKDFEDGYGFKFGKTLPLLEWLKTYTLD